MKRWQLVVISVSLLSVSGCMSTAATTELLEAPFVATTDLTGGTTAAVEDITAAVTDFTSSTTPGAADIKNPARARKRLELFASHSYENLRSDISRGSGEYLVSLATLAGISSDHLPEFQFHMQDLYAAMFDEKMPVKDSTARIVTMSWEKGYGRPE